MNKRINYPMAEEVLNKEEFNAVKEGLKGLEESLLWTHTDLAGILDVGFEFMNSLSNEDKEELIGAVALKTAIKILTEQDIKELSEYDIYHLANKKIGEKIENEILKVKVNHRNRLVKV